MMTDYNEIFEYREGELWWKVRRPGARRGKPAGGACAGNGYKKVRVDGRLLYHHRVIWEMHHGPIPEGMVIDHIDRDNRNNKIENLRCVTKQGNSFNTGALGFSYHEQRSTPEFPKWASYIQVDGDTKYLGLFDNVIDARSAYLRAKMELHNGI